LKNVIACALQVDPKKRIISRDLQLHPWFTCNLNILPLEESFPEIPRPKVNSRENRKM
jgi:serine/threonine protein kinase